MRWEKKLLSGRLIIFLLSAFLLNGCGMRLVHIRAFKPALITVPAEVKTLVLINRANPVDKSQKVVGAILSADLPGDRKAAIAEVFRGLQDQLAVTGRYNIIIADEELPGSSIYSSFPEAMPWQQVNEICEKYEADAAITLEIFTTKFMISQGTRLATKTVELAGIKKSIEVPEFYASGIATADIGFRFYDPVLNTIADEKLFSQNGNWEASGASPTDALGVLINKTEAQKKVSYDAGYSYGTRISPTPITITRPFYNRPKKNLPISKGTRQADAGQWAEALDTWEKGAENAQKKKIASRLAYNTAIGYEVMGDFETALQWANKCYIDYGNKKGLEYSRSLEYRINEERILEEQTN